MKPKEPKGNSRAALVANWLAMDLSHIFGGFGGDKGKGGETQSKPPPKLNFEPNPAKWFQPGLTTEQREADLKKLSSKIDLDSMRAAFLKHAGPDEMMDRDEFERFAKARNLLEKAPMLWNAMDADRSGSVDKDEFLNALHNLTSARAWLRFCPTCMFANECEMCVRTLDCEQCNSQRFCVKHWAEHPGNKMGTDEAR
ncbi:hypothetical protein AB1Y20_018733 [Prymnesium parvum]|uniref:EF-hand domain-containing protein n=1 Tax=Prymnesium parvum TaxID=97485 RepID=A0AB34JR02_PRYPA